LSKLTEEKEKLEFFFIKKQILEQFKYYFVFEGLISIQKQIFNEIMVELGNIEVANLIVFIQKLKQKIQNVLFNIFKEYSLYESYSSDTIITLSKKNTNK